MQTLILWLDLFGVMVFAVTGSMAAGEKRMDLFGVVVLATVTALGGGTLRDLILGVSPVFWVTAPVYLWVTTVSAVLTFFYVRFFHPPHSLLVVGDAVGLAVFTVIGTQKAVALGAPTEVALVMGVMTGVVGGMIRDLLSGDIPLVLRREVYATASLCGALVLIVVPQFGLDDRLAVLGAMLTTLTIRLAALRWRLSLPIYVGRSR